MKRITIKQSLENSLKPAYYLLGSLVAVAFITGTFLVSNRVNADNDTVVDDVSIEVPVSCSMSGNVTTAHTATLMNGIYSGGTTEYANGIGSTTLSVSCNDPGGFSIYTVGFTGDKEGDNTLKGTNTGLTIPTGVYSSGDTTSKWSMKITKGADSGDTTNHPLTIDNGFDSYHTVPSRSDGYQRIAHKDAATDMSATPGASVTTTYDAYIDTTQAADTYTGQVKYVMVHPFSSTDDNKPVIEVTYIQDYTDEMCAAGAADAPFIVTDKRDGKDYTVRWINGNCIMTQNLAFTGSTLDPATSNVDTAKTLTWHDLTDNSSCDGDDEDGGPGYTNACYHDSGDTENGVYYNFVGASVGTSTGAEETEDNVYNVCPAGWTLPEWYQYSAIADADNTLFSGVHSGYYDNGTLINTLYSDPYGTWWLSNRDESYWHTAMAYIYDSLSTSSSDIFMLRHYGIPIRCVRKKVPVTVTVDFADSGISSVIFSTSVEPYSEEEQTVSTDGGTVTLVSGVNYLVSANLAPGHAFGSWTKNSGLGTLSSGDSLQAHFLTGSGDATLSISTTTPSQYIQDFTNSMCQEQASDSPVALLDKRDNNSYTVRYINGNCWMTQNLRFDGTDLDPATSNVTSSTTLDWQDSSYYSSKCGSQDYDSLCKINTGRFDVGIEYNYAGATAGTITGSSNTDEDVENICPAGWTLPTNSQQSGMTSYASVFSPVQMDGLSWWSSNDWWSSTANEATKRHYMYYDDDNNSLGVYAFSRASKYSIRCVRK